MGLGANLSTARFRCSWNDVCFTAVPLQTLRWQLSNLGKHDVMVDDDDDDDDDDKPLGNCQACCLNGFHRRSVSLEL